MNLETVIGYLFLYILVGIIEAEWERSCKPCELVLHIIFFLAEERACQQ